MPVLKASDTLTSEKVYKRYWWPHAYAKPYLWRKIVVAYRYYINGKEVCFIGRL